MTPPGSPPSPTDHCRLSIKVIPNAPRHEIVGWLGDSLKIKIHAPALEGRANEALCSFLAESLGLPRRAIHIVSGEKSRQKVLQIDGLSLDALKASLG